MGLGQEGVPGTGDSGRRGGRLVRRTVIVSVLLSAVIGGAFSLLALAIEALRDSEDRANHALEVLVAANELERLLINVETAQRGFIITGKALFLEQWSDAQDAVEQRAVDLERLASQGNSGQGTRAQQIRQATDAYIREYSIPLVTRARSDPASARTVQVTLDGKRRIDALRAQFRQFMQDETKVFQAGQGRADSSAHLAFVAAFVSVAGSIILILLSGGYLARYVVRPVRRAAAMAGHVAGGDLTARMPETGPAEVGVLERSLNQMAGSLETSRAQLAASRARVVAAADETRRRIERDLHDGTQQRLISLALELRAAEAQVPPEQRHLTEQWSRTARGLNEVVEELREISRGLHPAILEKGGLGPALRALGRRSGVPSEINVRVSVRLPARVEVAAYYVVSEALTNAAKHARASQVRVDADLAGRELRLLVQDDGMGGADPSRGSGLLGLSDRVEAVGGTIQITSPPGGGTSLLVTIPVQPALTRQALAVPRPRAAPLPAPAEAGKGGVPHGQGGQPHHILAATTVFGAR
jgi:signal transduction histidine kinase